MSFSKDVLDKPSSSRPRIPSGRRPGSAKSTSSRSFTRPSRKRARDYTAVCWDKYWDSFKDLAIGEDSFRVYIRGTAGPVILLLHGGGYSGLSWSLLASFLSTRIECRVIAPDFRGHGDTVCSDEVDLSADTLSKDIGNIVRSLYSTEEEPPGIVIVGHSMGGAIASHVAHKNLIPSAIALVVIDVVEGTALSALQSMQNFLRSRPPSFASLPIAIEWCVRSGQVRNMASAKVSMPGQLKNIHTNKCAASELPIPPEEQNIVPAPRKVSVDSIAEEDSDEDRNKHRGPPPKYAWRIDLSKSEKYWTGWFEGLSNMFLSSAVPKLLLLAGVDRLDKDLTIAQMQGKFQMKVLPQCGHAVHEDDPDSVAEALQIFLARHKFVKSLIPLSPKIMASC